MASSEPPHDSFAAPGGASEAASPPSDPLDSPCATQLLTVQQLAEYLQVDRATVYRWAAERDLPAIRLSPKKLRFDTRDIRDWLTARKA